MKTNFFNNVKDLNINPRTAFRDFETAARNGFATARTERGVKLNIESCLFKIIFLLPVLY